MSTEQRKSGRGPYRIGDVTTGNRNADLLRDPQVAAFANAFGRIKDPRYRAVVEDLIHELAPKKGLEQHASDQSQYATFARDGVLCLAALCQTQRSRISPSQLIQPSARSVRRPLAMTLPRSATRFGRARAPMSRSAAPNSTISSGLAAYVKSTGAERLRDTVETQSGKGRFMVEPVLGPAMTLLPSSSSALPSVAGELLDAQHIRFYDDQIFVKEAGADRSDCLPPRSWVISTSMAIRAVWSGRPSTPPIATAASWVTCGVHTFGARRSSQILSCRD